MQVVKPLGLGLQTRCIEYRRRLGLCVTATVYFPFTPAGQGQVWTDLSMWAFLGQQMPGGPLIDEGVAKTRGEYLVHGQAHPPQPGARGCVVHAQVGSRRKVAHVFGPRRWVPGGVSEPEPLSPIPLDWAHTYGGPAHAANPLGMGHAPQVLADGSPVHWLPQVVPPGHQLSHRQEAAPSVAFGAIDLTWPQRARWQGTYDQRWLKEQSPGYADDLDWRFFNMAPEDQWFDTPLRGDEPYEFGHMHPTRPVVGGALPGLKAAVFVAQGPLDGELNLREVAMNLTTVWFFPHAERGVLVFHGLTPCEEDDGADITLLAGALEHLSQPKPAQHYRDAIRQRLTPDDALVSALRDTDLMPSGLKGTDPDFEATQQEYRPEGLMAEAQRRGMCLQASVAYDQAIAAGAKAEQLVIPSGAAMKPPTLETLPEVLRQAQADALNQQVTALCDAAEAAQAAKAELARLKVDPASLVHRGPPTFKAGAEVAALQRQVAAAGPRAANLVDFPKVGAALAQVEAMEREAYRQAAHTQAPALRLPPEAATPVRERVQAQLQRGESLMGANLTGADLSGLDLSGADLTGAWLESANLRGTRLDGACLAFAVLAHADLSEVEASEASFSGANLGKAVLTTARLRQCNLAGAILSHCDLAQTDLQGSQLHNAQWFDATFGLADWRQVNASGLLFNKATLTGLVLRQARLVQPVFIECDLSGVDFAGAELERPTFIQCKGLGTRFFKARMEGAIFAKGCDFSGADFSQAALAKSNLRGSVLKGAKLDGAQLDDADLSECDLSQASLVGARAQRALLVKAKLVQAQASQFNGMNAILQRADLRGLRAAGALLYGADLSRVRFDEHSLLPGLSAARARTWPRRADQPHPPELA